MNARAMSPSMIRGVVLGAALLASVSLPASASATRSGPDAPARASSQGPSSVTSKPGAPSDPIRVTVAPGIDDASLIPTWIDDRNATVARELALPGHEQWVDVSIAGATYDYRVTVTLMRDGAPLGAPLEPAPCACNTDELLTLVGEQLAIAAERAKSTPVKRQEARAETTPRVEPEPEPEPESESAPTRRPDPRFTGLGKAGLALVAVGGAGALAGAVMVGVNRGEPLPHGYSYLERDWRNPTGYVFLGVGGAVLVGGVVTLTLDVTRCQRNPNAPGCSQLPEPRDGRRARTVRGAPWAAAHGAGLSLWGRF